MNNVANNPDSFYQDMPSVKILNSAIAAAEASIQQSVSNMEYRERNYYNCVDDFSSGGIMDTIAVENIATQQNRIAIYKEQLANGSIKVKAVSEVLLNVDGTVASDTLVNGKFGLIWILKSGGVVGASLKKSAYVTKGFKRGTQITEMEVYYLCRESRKGKPLQRARILNQSILEGAPEENDVYLSLIHI